jgi:predicted RNA binding protein YcfA (HicA-like mRNA interferase family)
MSRRDKLLARIRNNPRGVTFDELTKVLEWHGFELRRSKGSHHVYVRGHYRITVVWRRPHVHPDAVKEALGIIGEILEVE